MNRKKLGSQGLEVSVLGLGCMGMTPGYGPGDQESGRETIGQALELGVTFFDTAEIYGPHTNEVLVGRAVEGRRDQVEIATKFGFPADPENPPARRLDGSPENARRSCDESLQRLGVDYIDLYYLNRIDPSVPIEETVGAMADLVHAGKVRYIGLSEAAPETIRRAHAVHPLTAVQTEYSLWTRDPEQGVLSTLRDLGIGLVAYAPLGRGFLAGGIRSVDDLFESDWRRTNPRFQEDALGVNGAIADRIQALAEERGVTSAQLSLAWVMARGEDIFPIPGTKTREHLEENVAAVAIELSPTDIAALDAAVRSAPVAGDRYVARDMALVNR